MTEDHQLERGVPEHEVRDQVQRGLGVGPQLGAVELELDGGDLLAPDAALEVLELPFGLAQGDLVLLVVEDGQRLGLDERLGQDCTEQAQKQRGRESHPP